MCDTFQRTFLHFWIASQDFSQDVWNLDNILGRVILLVFFFTFQLRYKTKGNIIRLYPE